MHVAVIDAMVLVRRLPRALRLVLVMLAWLALPGRASAQAPCAAAAPAPCVIANTVDVTSGTVWDVGTRTLTIAAGKTVNVKDDGVLTMRAAAITLDANAKIVATGTPGELGGFGGFLKLQATAGNVDLKAGSRIDVSAAIAAGLIGITARGGGSIQMQGELRAKSTAPAGSGGFVSLDGDGAVTIGGLGIDCTGGAEADGGSIELTSRQGIVVSELLDASGGDLDGGTVDVDAGTTVTTQGDGVIDIHARSGAGSGGSVLITTGGAVTLNAEIVGTASAVDEDFGAGADIEITSDTGNVTIAALVDVRGGGLDGDGGGVSVVAGGAINVTAQILAAAKATGFGLGGVVSLDAGTSVAIGSIVDVRGGIVGGALEASAGTSAALTGTVFASGTTPSTVASSGGIVLIQGCTINLPQNASIVNLGTAAADRGINRLQASSSMTIGGTLTAGIDNFLEWRDVPPTLLATQTITPPPSLPHNTALPCCVGCGGSTTTSSTTTSTTSTTSSTTTTTSTTVAGSTSSTTTTIAVTTTTTSSTIAASTTTTVVSTTVPTTSTSSTTAPPPTSTTTTTLPVACVDQPLLGYDAVSCRLDTIGTVLVGQPVEALGGKKLATRLGKTMAHARTALDMARGGRKVTPNLRRANKQLRLFGKGVTSALKKGMAPELGAQLTSLAAGATTEIDVLRATPQ
ncbi:MAG TPA: hypothetical protein VGR62_11115 [Candidatus Binatia bacterium]|jgi:hypothetical protein|nr:hypothetical protein [Candidatus Binatia bacterium]